MENDKSVYLSVTRASHFLVIWILGLILISIILYYLSLTILYEFSIAIYTFILCYTFCNFLDRESILDLGLRLRKVEVINLFVGILIGAFMMTLIFLIELGFKLVYVKVNNNVVFNYLIYGILTFFLVGFTEELVFRGYFLNRLLLSLDEKYAILLSSIIFSLLHFFNPNANFLGFMVLSTMGVLLGLCYLKTRSLYLPIGLHFAWNYFEGFVYGLPVSGREIKGLLLSRVEGPSWLTGGTFGPEGSFIGLIIALLNTLAIFLLFKIKEESNDEY